MKELFDKIEGIDTLMEDPEITSVRLVTNPEKMVLRETQRAFVYFSLHGLTVDEVIVNRILPAEVEDQYFAEWRQSQARFLMEAGYVTPKGHTHWWPAQVQQLLDGRFDQYYTRGKLPASAA